MDEEANQLKLEVERAERKGTEAVYEVLVGRLRKLGKKANESKATKDVLTFEEKLNSALELWERVFEENWNKNHPGQGAEYNSTKKQSFERQRNEELVRLESFLDEPLRAK